MTAPLSPAALANRALAKFGGGTVTGLTDATPAGAAVQATYETLVGDLLASYPWTFTKDVVALARLADETPDVNGYLASGWRFEHALPAQRLAPPDKYLIDPRREDLPLTRFQVMNERVYSDCDKLWAVGRFRVDEARWPPYFVAAFIDCLAAELVLPITGNASIRDNLRAEAYGTPQEGKRGGAIGRAQNTDARNSGGQALDLRGLLAGMRYG